MGERRIPETLEEAYRLRDTADSLQERDFYQEQVYHLRREEYRSRGIRTEISSRRRERQTAYPSRGGMAYAVERAAIQIRDLPGGMILILLTFFASLFAFVWATQTWDNAKAGTIFFVSLGLVAAGALMLISAIFIVTFIRSINK